MLATINIIIGLILVLLLFSLLTSTVMEVIAALLSLRAHHLRYTLHNMLGEKLEDFIQHPLFRQLSFATNRRKNLTLYSLPSWISKESFTTILKDILNAKDPNRLVNSIENMKEGDTKQMLEFLIRNTGMDLKAFEEQSGKWFNEVMERATEWYKRRLKWWLFGVGLVLAAIFNADTIRIYQNISTNTTAREYLVAMAEDIANRTDTLDVNAEPVSVEASIEKLNNLLQSKIEPLRSPLGLGWNFESQQNWFYFWLLKIAGLLITAVAVTFGAPFWFDLLRKILAIKGSINGKEASNNANNQEEKSSVTTSTSTISTKQVIQEISMQPAPPSIQPPIPPVASEGEPAQETHSSPNKPEISSNKKPVG